MNQLVYLELNKYIDYLADKDKEFLLCFVIGYDNSKNNIAA
jgi:hypothetical protein